MFYYREPLEPLFKLNIQTEGETYYKLNIVDLPCHVEGSCFYC